MEIFIKKIDESLFALWRKGFFMLAAIRVSVGGKGG
jgi:hypothetical protein